MTEIDLTLNTPAALRAWAEQLSPDLLRIAITHWEQEQTLAGGGKGRKHATRVLGYLRREQRKRWLIGQ